MFILNGIFFRIKYPLSSEWETERVREDASGDKDAAKMVENTAKLANIQVLHKTGDSELNFALNI